MAHPDQAQFIAQLFRLMKKLQTFLQHRGRVSVLLGQEGQKPELQGTFATVSLVLLCMPICATKFRVSGVEG